MTTGEHEEFSAWIDKQPGANNTLHVKGEATVPTSGWSGSLSEASPQGINPRILILDAHLSKPSGIVNEVISKILLTFDKTNSPEYDSVTIRGLGDDFDVDVTTTH